MVLGKSSDMRLGRGGNHHSHAASSLLMAESARHAHMHARTRTRARTLQLQPQLRAYAAISMLHQILSANKEGIMESWLVTKQFTGLGIKYLLYIHTS